MDVDLKERGEYPLFIFLVGQYSIQTQWRYYLLLAVGIVEDIIRKGSGASAKILFYINVFVFDMTQPIKVEYSIAV